MPCKITENAIECIRDYGSSKVVTVRILKCSVKNNWYEEMIGNIMKCKIYENNRKAFSLSLGFDYAINDGDFQVIKGKDIRRERDKS